MSVELPNSFKSSSKSGNHLGIILFGLTTFVLIYQIYFYNEFIKSLKKNGDADERIARLERLISNDKT